VAFWNPVCDDSMGGRGGIESRPVAKPDGVFPLGRRSVGMEPLREFLNAVRHHSTARGNLLGLLHILIGRRLTRTDGAPISGGMTWRELAMVFKQLRWDREAVRELQLDPADLPPRDRERFWYTAIAQAGLASAAAKTAGDRLVGPLKALGYVVGPAPRGSASSSS
jgi:hypothetical protein